MAILLTGGTGKTTSQITHLCLSTKTPFLLATRKGPSPSLSEIPHVVKFDWIDPSTFQNCFNYTPSTTTTSSASASDTKEVLKIHAIYLIAPEIPDPVQVMGPFIELARQNGVKKFVFLTGSSAERGGEGPGKVWNLLESSKGSGEGEGEGEVVVLRGTWFMDNFLTWHHNTSIKQESKIYSACGTGKIPFVSTQDIAKMAFHILTADNPSTPFQSSYRLLGPELLSFDDVAQILSSKLGKDISHIQISEEESRERFLGMGMPNHIAEFLASIEGATASGIEEFEGGDFEMVMGTRPESFEEWVERVKGGFVD
ncbi:hypothetical protein HYFRA_00003080 [Hymenoscyphus fraxineus]|uniref:NmrA-like domain-containing protein n=1 Tax=Hymenoscyphus fraxineus TaxID=746836 RepID=A0A9N9KQF3_9HELO|nr:hypothetical protein HYFRA_00003080 [Hymenoscyphus fraxineus]